MVASVVNPQVGSTRITRIVEETTSGQTPTGAQWEVFRNSGGAGVTPNIETITSSELTGTKVLGLRDVIRVATQGQADYNFEFSKGAPFELLMESLLQNKFGLAPDGTAGTADVLVPGSGEVTFTLEDEFADISDNVALSGCRATSLGISIVNQQIVTGTLTCLGTDITVQKQHDVANRDAADAFTGGDTITFATASITAQFPWLKAGMYVAIGGATTTSNDGYYRIAAITANTIEVDGSFINEVIPVSAIIRVSGQSVYSAKAGTIAATNTNQAFRSGDSIDLMFSEDGGTTWYDPEIAGYCFPQADVTINTESAQLYCITKDDPAYVVATNRTVELNLTYYLVNLSPVRTLLADKELAMRFTLNDPDGNAYQFMFPRVKSSDANAGDATLGSEMQGTWNLQALLDDNNLLVEITRV